MLQQGYRLIIIEQEKVPLASGPGTAGNLIGVAFAVMLAVAIFACLWAYLAHCRDYRERIRKSDPGGEAHLSWNIWRLRQMAEEFELDRAGAF